MNKLVIIRGGGDIATGTIYKLYRCGFQVLILEIEKPSAIRREVAFCEAVYEGEKTVEDVTCYRASGVEEAKQFLQEGKLTLLVDPEGTAIKALQPAAVVDAILAKRNLGTTRDLAPITIGLGPGFSAGVDVDVVIETMRGHQLGRIITQGSAMANTGIPGEIGGYGKERVIHSPASGRIRNHRRLTEIVNAGDVIAYVEHENERVPVTASISGILRGLIRDGYQVKQGMKIADIDPRIEERENCFTISDKARCIAGSVLEVILRGNRFD